MMDLINRLSSSQGRKDQKPNIELGKEIALQQDIDSIEKIKSMLDTDLHLDALCDFIKVLESIGEVNPELIVTLYPALKKLLHHPKNHVVWRAMCVLSQIARYQPESAYEDLGRILLVMDGGSVITRDHGFNVLIDLYQVPKFSTDIRPLIIEQLQTSPDNQFGQYAEKWIRVIQAPDVLALMNIIEQRLPEFGKEAHQKRATKIYLKAQKMKPTQS